MRLIIALALLFGAVAGIASPLRLPLSTGNFVRLLVGHPGIYLNLQVNTSATDIELYAPLYLRSQSELLRRDGTGEEVFFFNGDTRLWLPYRLNPFPDKDSMRFYPPGDGVFGLGRHSRLFNFWHNYTLNSQYLYLGYYDPYSQLSADERAPVLLANEPAACQLDDGGACRVVLDPGRVDTFLPAALYHRTPHSLTLRSSNCQHQYREIGMEASSCEDTETLQLTESSVRLVNGLEYNATRRHDGSEIRLGLHFLEEHSVFHDHVRGRQFFTPSAFALRPSNYVALCIVVLAFILMAWATIVTVDRYGSEWTFNLTFMLEFYGYLVCTVAWASTLFGLRWARLVANFLRMPAAPLLVFISLALLACLLGSLWLLTHFDLQITLQPRAGRMARNKAEASRLKHLRLLFFPSAVLMTLWLCVLQNHNSLPDIVYLLVFVTALCINATLLACAAYVYALAHRWVNYTALVPLYVFMWFTLVPTFNVVDLHYSTLLEAAGYTLFAVLMPSVGVFMKYAVQRAEQKAMRRKAE